MHYKIIYSPKNLNSQIKQIHNNKTTANLSASGGFELTLHSGILITAQTIETHTSSA